MALLSPENIITTFGLLGMGLVLFCETGLFFCFFLPGDSLILSAGVFASQGFFSLGAMFLVMIFFAIAGNYLGYFVGKKMGQYLFKKKDTTFFKKEYLQKAEIFYNKYGILALLIGRFVPIVRTFVPLIAGAVNMNQRVFSIYNFLGAFLWVLFFGLLGYFLGSFLPKEEILHWAIIWFLVFTVLTPFFPRIFRFLKKRFTKNSDTLSE